MDEKKSEDNESSSSSAASATTTTTSIMATPSKVEANFVAPLGPNVRVSRHPVLAHKLSVLRSSSTVPSMFRAALREITFHLGYEATSTLSTRDVPITVPSSSDPSTHVDAIGKKIKERVALIPVLRSGLGMVDPMLELITGATVHHIGMYKNKSSQMPVQYYNRLPKVCGVDVAYVLDPLIATSNTVTSVVGMLKKWGVSEIHVLSVIASKRGLSELLKRHPDVHVTLGVIDDMLSDEGDVLPGLGDAGDRLFGTGEVGEEDELVHVSKRKRTMSDL